MKILHFKSIYPLLTKIRSISSKKKTIQNPINKPTLFSNFNLNPEHFDLSHSLTLYILLVVVWIAAVAFWVVFYLTKRFLAKQIAQFA